MGQRFLGGILVMRSAKSCLAFAAISLTAGAPAWANLIITPTFAANINSDANAVTIKATINAAIAVYQTKFADPITVNITFQEGGGLGSSNSFFSNVTYAAYLA